MAVLVGCEESQTVCRAFRAVDIESFSCDINPTRGNPQWHYQCDIVEVLMSRRWSLAILHPDCTAMAVSGNRWYGRGMPRHPERLAQVEWTKRLWILAKKQADRVALENPVSVIFSELPNVHYIQPWQFGHGETKKTGFALHNLPPLTATNIVEGREQKIWKMAPSKTRKRDRSKTFPGVAEAMADQWGRIL